MQHHRAVDVFGGVNHLKRNEFVAVFLDKLAEGFDDVFGILFLRGVEAHKFERVDVDFVDNLLVAAAHVFDVEPYFGVVKRFYSLFFEPFLCLFYLLRCGVGGVEVGFGCFGYVVLVETFQQTVGDYCGGGLRLLLKLFLLFG